MKNPENEKKNTKVFILTKTHLHTHKLYFYKKKSQTN
jgi:hypothetical protein